MSDFVISLAIGIVFTTVSIALVLGVYFASRAAFGSPQEGDRTHEAAINVATGIAALHGLILALVYAQELDDYKGIRSDLSKEAIAISDVFNDMRRYGGSDVAAVQQGLADYIATVVDGEWASLGRGEGLSTRGWLQWNGVYERILDLEPITERQRFLAERMRERIAVVAELRQTREATATGRFSSLFWGPAIIGLVLLSVPLYVYRPNRTYLMLFALFGAYSGVILFFIYGFANPFSNPGKLEPKPFLHLLEGDIGKSLAPPNPVGSD
ncbi:hypothetical protein GCM10011390_23090 [Aureimonas endophytica]|uniref:DUF4239 domain-containing protein n=1 Tax=Aureimonas endophytica TaxID=2027858 RepID=A0A916ZMM9_9HYPH|nr:DUF4239 domain-containing protein [Aureimonas endophytica]GGE03558.1 hypothetical protein GCM10011390_23090 [Aureimonas endophytica]